MSDAFNGSFLGVRESSSATPAYVEEYAIDRANSKSDAVGSDQFYIVFNSKNNSFGLAFSDGIKDNLGFAKNFYYLVQANNKQSSDDDLSGDSLFPTDAERDKWVNDFNTEISALLNNNLNQLNNNYGFVETSLNELSDSKQVELNEFIKTAQTSAKSEITKHTNAKKTEITEYVTSELERVSFDENEEIAQLKTEIETLKQKVNELESTEDSGQSVGLTIDDVRLEIENSKTESSSSDTYLTQAEIESLISTKLTDIGFNNSNPSDPTLIDDTEILP